MNDLDEIKHEVIARGFPELRDVHIETSYCVMDNYFLGVEREERFLYSLYVNQDPLMHAPPSVLVGGMAHEMSHVLKGIKMPNILNIFDVLLFTFSKTYERYDERSTDKEAAKRGFARELIEFAEYTNHIRKENPNYLSIKELEKYLH